MCAERARSVRSQLGVCATAMPSAIRTHLRMHPQATFVLFESASGFALFEVRELDEIGQAADKVQATVR